MATTTKKRRHSISPSGTDENSHSALVNYASNGEAIACKFAINEPPGTNFPIPSQCADLIGRGALLALSHSGGKDSQARTILVSRIVPRDQLVAVHAPLGEVEWPSTVEHIQNTIPPGVPLIVAPVTSGKTLLQQVEERGMWPSKFARWCTSDFYGELTIVAGRTPPLRIPAYLTAIPGTLDRDSCVT